MTFAPYLGFNGNCKEAMTFYAAVLGGRITAMIPHRGTPAEGQVPDAWKDKIIHARLELDGGVLMAGDAPPGHYQKPQGFSIHLAAATPDEAERLFGALAEQGAILMPMEETFWALRFGMLVDRFGTPWMINCEKAAAGG